jgi:Sec-independent protein translocase protein TatA
MLAFIFNFGPFEFMIVLLVAILVFGRNLPSVAVQAASMVQKMRRSLSDLRRETGIDEELRRARRELDEAIPRDLPNLKDLDVGKIVEHAIDKSDESEAKKRDEPAEEA